MKRVVSAILAMLMILALSAVGFVSAEKELSDKVVYISADGKLENDGLSVENAVPTFARAMEVLGIDGGTVVICGTVIMDSKNRMNWIASEKEGMKRIVLTGLDDNAVLDWRCSLNPKGAFTVEYINILMNATWSYLNANGHDLVLGYGIYNSRANEKITTDLCIRGGGDTNVNIDGDTNVTVYSGKYTQICGGSRNGYIAGDTHITVYGGEIGTLAGGNNNGGKPEEREGKNVRGDSYITIYGGIINSCRGDDGNSIVEGKRHLDITKYPLAKEAWFAYFDDIKMYDPNKVQEDAKKDEIIADASFINGYSDGTFKPQNQIKRAEAVAIISRLIAKDEDIKGKFTSNFSDVKSDAWYYSNVAFLESKGYLDFMRARSNRFLPEEPITRGEVCGLIYQIGTFNATKEMTFSDLSIRDNKKQIITLASEGIVTGYEDGTFRASKTITRAEFVTIVDRFLKRVTNDDNVDYANKFSDISNHWAKKYIVAASTGNVIDGKEIWSMNTKTEAFALSENAKTAEQYIKELKSASEKLAPSAITEGIEMLSQKRIAEIKATKTSVEVSGTKYYVSENGNDANDGLSPEKAIKSLQKVSSLPLNAGDGVFFERGGLWRGNITTKAGVTYSAYGEGEKPKLFGWEKNSADPALWKQTEVPHVYEYADAYELSIGNIIFNHGEKYTRKIILQYEEDKTTKDVRTKQPYAGIKDITEDLSFYHDFEGTGKIWLRCEAGNPGEVFDDIEMAIKRHVLSGTGNDVTLDNLDVRYTGSHGIGVGSAKGLTVQNCEFSWIGGSIQTNLGAYGRNWHTPYGNAIEIYGQAVDFTVNNCYIHDVYDAGITHQSGASIKANDKNVKYYDNVVEKCVYAIEIFVSDNQDGHQNSHDDILIENNILRMGSGFGHDQRPDTGVTALIRNGAITKNTTNYVVRNNILDRSKNRLITAAADGGSMAEYYDNIYVQNANVAFCTRDGITFVANAGVREQLESNGKEHNPTIIILNEEINY